MSGAPIELSDLRRYAIGRSLFPPTTLARALERLGFVQADPIRAPARAQDLILRQRVNGYRAGDLERDYAALGIEEDFFINYGFVPRSTYQLMHPRRVPAARHKLNARRARALLEFVSQRVVVHPREVDKHFAHGSVTNYWGGSSNATTHLLDALHYRGELRVVGREGGVRLYALHARAARGAVPEKQTARAVAADRAARLDALVNVVVGQYAPLTASGLAYSVGRLRYALPQWPRERAAALARAKLRLAHTEHAGTRWYWPASERPQAQRIAHFERVRLLAPFDPLVWDRGRFELLWGWPYRFEAYTPAAKRKLGYYALPLLWREDVIGWANLTWKSGQLDCQLGFQRSRPRDPTFDRELDAELTRMRAFLG